jgi:hypothetical protein
MAYTNLNHHLYHWVEKIESNISKFKTQEGITDEERIEFITHQYHLVMLMFRALNGQVIFVGANPIEIPEDPVQVDE